MNGRNIVKKIRSKMRQFKEVWLYGQMDRKQTFEYIYANKKWGSQTEKNEHANGLEGEFLIKQEEEARFYSGEGSHKEKYLEPYCQLIRDFIIENGITRVCDIGCGDFNVASKWISKSIVYEGVDIVQEMIDHHKAKYGTDNIHFHCLDIVEDDLPDAQLCLVRQVLQHLSNEEVACFLDKIGKYEYTIITEHVTEKSCAKKFNIDKVHGSGIRVSRQSGLYFDEEPFNLKVKTLLTIPYDSMQRKEVLVSVLIKNVPDN